MTKRIVATIVRLAGFAVMGGAGFGIGCGPEELGDSAISDWEDVSTVQQADGLCGANLQRATVTQTCTYSGKASRPPSPKPPKGLEPVGMVVIDGAVVATGGLCDGVSKVVCSYKLVSLTNNTDGCRWKLNPGTSTCSTNEPACPDPAIPPNQPTKTSSVDLQTGNTLCDQMPAATAAELTAYCQANAPASMGADLVKLCTDQNAPTKTQQVECCVPAPPPPTSSGMSGSSSGGYDSSSSGGYDSSSSGGYDSSSSGGYDSSSSGGYDSSSSGGYGSSSSDVGAGAGGPGSSSSDVGAGAGGPGSSSSDVGAGASGPGSSSSGSY